MNTEMVKATFQRFLQHPFFKPALGTALVLLLVLSACTSTAEADRQSDIRRITLPQALILGTIEGLTEYLPVSSTGHLILAVDALQLGGFAHDRDGNIKQGPLGPIMEPNPAVNAFNIIIQIGAIFAVIGIYFRRIGEMAMGLVGRDENGRKLLINLLAAFLPAAVFGLLFDDLIEKYLFSPLTVAIALSVGGVAMIVLPRFLRRRGTQLQGIYDIGVRSALLIGLIQCLAMWPGTSRSMVTILAGLAIGLPMVAAAEFSFLLALPTLGAATLYKIMTEWDALTLSVGFDSLITGIVISTIVAAFSVRFLISHLTRHGLAPFGFYRIALAVGVIYYFTCSG